MSFEAEVIPLFIGGVCLVSVLELTVGSLVLKGRKRARSSLIGHAVSMAAAFFFLCRSMFANWLHVKYGIASIENSVNIGLFGVLWAVSVLFLLTLIDQLISDR